MHYVVVQIKNCLLYLYVPGSFRQHTCTDDANKSHLFADIDGIRHVDHEVGDKTPVGVVALRYVAGEGEYERDVQQTRCNTRHHKRQIDRHNRK